jgi:hypothetical protein
VRSTVLTLGVVVSQLALILTLAFGSPCAERCPDDRDDGRCFPGCMTCPCAPRPVEAASASAVSAPDPRSERAPAVVLLAPSDPAPVDISHVPKSLLA